MPGNDRFESLDHTIRLPDGRTLGYSEYGSPTGNTLFYFGSSRLEACLLARAAANAGVRVIGTDRPGMGLSQFQPGRRLLDWPADVVALADHLGIARFAVVGVSAGGPHALACAHAIPDRLTACGVVSGVGPVSNAFRRMPWLLTPMMWFMGRFFREKEQAKNSLMRFTGGWPEADRNSLGVPEIGDLWAASLVEAFRQGPRGMTHDSLLVEGRPWDFGVEDISFPMVLLWHGELDKDVPVANGRAIAERLSRCDATYYPGEGHLSVLVNHGDEIVTNLTSRDSLFLAG